MHALESARPDSGQLAPLRRFEALYRGEFAFVWAVACHLGVSSEVIDEVVQDVFLTAYRRLDHLNFEVSPRAWLFGVTRRVAARYRRSAVRRASRHALFAEVTHPGAATPQERLDDARQLDRLLARLGDATREVWQMTELLGMSGPEIASELRVPLNTVYSRLRLAREQLHALCGGASLEAERDGARRRQHPPRQAQQRTWALLLPTLGHSGGGAALLVGIKTPTAMATTLVSAGAALILAVQPAPPRSGMPAAAPPSPVASPAADDGTARDVSAATEPPPAPTVESAAPPRPVPRMSSRTDSPRTTMAHARLGEEIALIDWARAQLAADDVSAALATIASHAFVFPHGALADVREAARVDALCRRGDVPGAEAAARRLVAEFPDSAVAQGFTYFRCSR